MRARRPWTVYIAPDKHLDYNWCGTHAEIETRMAQLLDFHLGLAERRGRKWNIDSTLWLDAYRRQRGEQGAERLLDAIRKGRIGYGAAHSVLLWGLMGTELAFRALYDSAVIQERTGTANETALIMENRGLPWGVAEILAGAGFKYVARGTLPLRAESYDGKRLPYPLFWWISPSGRKLLVSWPPYVETGRWGGYAEAYELCRLAGEKWDAFNVRDFGDRNTAAVYRKRKAYIAETVRHYEEFGDNYPVESIMLLGSGWDNWSRTEDLYRFIDRYNREAGTGIRLKAARYDEYFGAVARELGEKRLVLPEQRGSFGICWEEWAAYLAADNRAFRHAERALRLAEAENAMKFIGNRGFSPGNAHIKKAWDYLLDFAEHDMGGCNRLCAAISAGVRADSSTRALSLARGLHAGPLPAVDVGPLPVPSRKGRPGFKWNGFRGRFDAARGCPVSLRDSRGHEWVPPGTGLGRFVHTFHAGNKNNRIFPPALNIRSLMTETRADFLRSRGGLEIRNEGRAGDSRVAARWVFHHRKPWIDVSWRIIGGWSEREQTVQFTFPVNMTAPSYHYDMAGAVLTAGGAGSGGDDLPGANTELYSVNSFAAATGDGRSLILLMPDNHLVRFGSENMHGPGFREKAAPARITAVPMMNIMRNDHQFNQGGRSEWVFSYRLVLLEGGISPVMALEEAQRFSIPPFLKAGATDSSPAVGKLGIRFPGVVTAVKVAEDGQRVIVRFWNPSDREEEGSLRPPRGFGGAELCDGLERATAPLKALGGRISFTAASRSIVTVALTAVSAPRQTWRHRQGPGATVQ